MKDVLDEEFIQADKAKKHSELEGVIYTIVMFFGGILFIKFFLRSGANASYWLLAKSALFLQVILVGSVALLRSIAHIIQSKRKEFFLTPLFWILNVRYGFMLWIVLLGLILSNKIL